MTHSTEAKRWSMMVSAESLIMTRNTDTMKSIDISSGFLRNQGLS